MTLNTIKNVTKISIEELGKVSGGKHRTIGFPIFPYPGMGEPIIREEDDERKDGGATGSW